MNENFSETNKIFVCGGGHQGLAMAAYLSLNGCDVSLWNRTSKHIRTVIDTGEIWCDGIVSGRAKINRASADIADVISDFIMVTTPSTAHKDIARILAPYVHKDMIIVLNPGRTFGAIEFVKTLEECGAKELPHIAETQTIVCTCRRDDKNKATIFALKKNVKIAALRGSDINVIMKRMPKCIREHFVVENSIALTSLTNVGMVLHCAPVLMNIGWIESHKADFKYYYDGISKSVADFIEKIDSERVEVAEALGYEIETTANWIKKSYNVEGDSLYECIRNNKAYDEIDAPPSLNTRYILEDVPNGLVPIEYLGKILGVNTANISVTVDLASIVYGIDFRMKGRKFDINYLNGYL